MTSPVTPGRHPALAIVHGSEPGGRDGYDLLVNFYTSLGYVVLSYDKRGIGDSSGFYIERPTPANIDNLAGDAVAALRVLAARRDVDPARLGLVGGSQAGWIIPRAAAKSPLVRFAVIVAGPAMSSGEEEAYAAITAHGQISPPPTDEAIRKGLEGVDAERLRPAPGPRTPLDPDALDLTGARTSRSTRRRAWRSSRRCRRSRRSASSPPPGTSSSTRRTTCSPSCPARTASSISRRSRAGSRRRCPSPRAVATAQSSPRRRHPEPGRGRPFSRR